MKIHWGQRDQNVSDECFVVDIRIRRRMNAVIFDTRFLFISPLERYSQVGENGEKRRKREREKTGRGSF